MPRQIKMNFSPPQKVPSSNHGRKLPIRYRESGNMTSLTARKSSLEPQTLKCYETPFLPFWLGDDPWLYLWAYETVYDNNPLSASLLDYRHTNLRISVPRPLGTIPPSWYLSIVITSSSHCQPDGLCVGQWWTKPVFPTRTHVRRHHNKIGSTMRYHIIVFFFFLE